VLSRPLSFQALKPVNLIQRDISGFEPRKLHPKGQFIRKANSESFPSSVLKNHSEWVEFWKEGRLRRGVTTRFTIGGVLEHPAIDVDVCGDNSHVMIA
jgi:hypothetical protein